MVPDPALKNENSPPMRRVDLCIVVVNGPQNAAADSPFSRRLLVNTSVSWAVNPEETSAQCPTRQPCSLAPVSTVAPSWIMKSRAMTPQPTTHVRQCRL